MEQIEKPSHYNRTGAMECIEEMVLIFGYDFAINFCIGNVFKYRYRADLKGSSIDDIKKSDEYIKIIVKLKARQKGLKGSEYEK